MFDYKLPSCRHVSGRLLDALYEREKARFISDLSGGGVSNLALITDGWTDTNGHGIINFVFVNPRTPPIFWKSVNTKPEVHSSEYIASTIWSAILEFEAAIGEGKVTAVVTGNASNMKKAWRLVRKHRLGLICTGCSAHGMNLLMKDLFKMEFFYDALKKSKVLAHFIKDRRGLSVRFRMMLKALRKNGEKRRWLSLPVPTRWYTHEKCIGNVYQNKDVLAAIFLGYCFAK